MEIDTASLSVVPGDRLLVCSDGLFNEVSEEEIASLIRSLETPEAVVAGLLESALSKGGNDNVSAVVAEVCA